MKKNILSNLLIVLIFIILLSCNGSENPIISEKDKQADQNLSKISTNITDCGNDRFPGYYDKDRNMINPAIKMTFEKCKNDPSGKETKRKIASYWYYYAFPYNDLDFRACSPSGAREFVVTETIINNHVKFSWNKMWSHFYVIQRKKGNSNWEIIKRIGNADDSNYEYIYTFEDNIDITNLTEKISYSISNQIYDEYFDAKIFEHGENSVKNLTTSISGTSTVQLPLKGSLTTVTWYAQVNGGTPNYKYEWKYNGRIVGTGSSYRKSYSYKGSNANYWHRLDLKVTDSSGKTSSSSKNINLKTSTGGRLRF